MTDNPLLGAALAYAKRGWLIIPVHDITAGRCSCSDGTACKTPGKHPRHKDWQNRGSTSAADLYEWWQMWPNANIGIVTGRTSGVWALDVDPDKGGTGAMVDLVEENQQLPITRLHATGSGGVHYLFCWPDGADEIPTTSGSLGTGIDTRASGNGMIVAPPSVSSKGGYAVLRDIDPIPAPQWLVDRLLEVQARRARGREVTAVTAEHVDINALPSKLRTRLTLLTVDDRSAYFHGTVAACRRAGLTQGQTVSALSVWCSVTGKFAGRVEAEVARSWGKLDDADPANDPDRYVQSLAESPDPESGLPAELVQLVALARTYQDIPDPGHLLVVLATAAVRDLDDDPTWLLLVAPPSSGKSEAVRVLDVCADAHLDDVTAAGMLSWKAGKRPRPTGVLTRVGERALVTFGDLSTLLADSDRGHRDSAFAILRKAYDGHVVRDLGSAPETLEWRGKLTVVGAVTGIIDNYAAHSDALGPRWVYYRMDGRDAAAKRRAAALARNGGLRAAREELAKQAAQVVYQARTRAKTIDIGDSLYKAVEDAALVTCWGRASVPRHGYGRREIDGLPVVEEPPRLIRQLLGVARGLLALGLPEALVEVLVRRVAIDSMPASRAMVLRALTFDSGSTAAVARAAGVDRKVTRFRLEELEQIGPVMATRIGEEPVGDDEVDRRICTWSLAGDGGEIVRQVFESWITDKKGWDETWVPYTQTPKEGDAREAEYVSTTHISSHLRRQQR